jgi:nucleoside-diphosphate-sugar epimerase
MRVVVIGGTRFIGRRIVEELVARGDEVTVVHRGATEPDGWIECEHIHVAREDFSTVADQVRAAAPDAVVDTLAMSRADTEAVLPRLPDTQIVLLSSMDVYRAFGHVLADREGEPVPLNEDSPVRDERYPYRDRGERPSDYDKLDVEPAYRERGAAVLRLAMIYGEHDPQRREEFILRRVRAGRPRIPVGPGSWLWTRCYVGDVAGAVLATLGNPRAAGEVFNIGEPAVRSIRGWAEEILAAAGHEAELVTAPEATLPDDMWITKTVAQHLVVDGSKAAAVLGWRATQAAEGLRRSVRWHLANPPDSDRADATDSTAADGRDDFTADDDFSADDTALAAAVAAEPPRFP